MKQPVIAIGLGILLATVCGCSASRNSGQVETCRLEMNKFCKGVAAGGGRILKCLQEHNAELSDACRAYANTASQYTACLDDVLRLCPDVEPGSGRAMQCLRANQGDLSTECKYELGRFSR